MTRSGDTAARLLALLPNDGTPRTNAELRKLLEVPDDEYWSVRNELVTDGVVTKLPGRGGRTALVVSESSRGEGEGSSGLAWLIPGVFGSSLFTVAVAVAYGVTSTGADNLVWNLLSLVFGGVALAAVGVSLLIYKVQTESAQLEAEGQVRVLRRLEGLARQAATSSSDTRELVRAMKPAVDATSTAGAAPISTNSEGEGDESRDQEQGEGAVLRDEYGAYYLPPAIPLKVVSDLVKWWDSEGATGRWTLSRLVGGYRQYNSSGNFVGVPWVLTFDGGKEGHRSFRLAYSGRQKGPAVSELEAGVWHDLEDGNER